MTIQFLRTWNGYEAGAVHTLSDGAEETRLIGLGIARDYAVGMDGASNTVSVLASRALTASDSGRVLRCSTAVTLTSPEGLGDEFSCLVEPPASGTVTTAVSGSCTQNGGTANLTRTRASNPAGFVIRALAANVFGVSGS